MKKVLALLIPAATYIIAAPFALATDLTICPPAGTPGSTLCHTNLTAFIPVLINILLVIAILLAVVYLLWGGIKWIMSGGDKQQLQTAREHVVAAIIGLVIVFLVYFLLNFILSTFGITTGGVFSLPTVQVAP
jgi:hypothetical protein